MPPDSTDRDAPISNIRPLRRSADSHAGKERLAFLLPNLGGGGVQKNTITIAKGLHRRGYPVDLVLCSDQGPLHCHLPDTFNIVRLQADKQWLARLQALRATTSLFLSQLRPVALAQKPSRTLRFLPSLVKYLHTTRPAALLSATVHQNIEAVLASKLSGAETRVVVTQSQQFSHWQRISSEWRRQHIQALARKAYTLADDRICVSEGVADDLTQSLGLARSDIDVIHNPVVTPELVTGAQQPIDHPWLQTGEPAVILSVGRPGRQKDFPTLLHAFAIVRKTHNVRLVILGEVRNPNKKHRRRIALASLTEQLGLTEVVDFHGFVHNPYAYMAKAAVFVLSSHYEGFGNAIAEALACGCPVVSTECPSGPAEILDYGRFGRLVPVGDAEAMARAMRAALDETPDRAHLRQRGEVFSVENAMDSYIRALTGRETEQPGQPNLSASARASSTVS